MSTGIKKEAENFLKGLWELIPQNLISSLFNHKELRILMSGKNQNDGKLNF